MITGLFVMFVLGLVSGIGATLFGLALVNGEKRSRQRGKRG